METIKCEVRSERGRAPVRKVRKAGRVPAVLYGKKEEVVALWVAGLDARRIVHEGLQELNVEAGGKAQAVRVGEIQFDTFGETVIHLDFLRA